MILTKLIAGFNAMATAMLYDRGRLGKEGALSRYNLNYLLLEGLEVFEVGEGVLPWTTRHVRREKDPLQSFPCESKR